MNGIFHPQVRKSTPAAWSLSSKDKRWCDSGPFIYRGMKGIPIEASIRIEELKLKYGEPPEDFTWGYRLGFWTYWLAKLNLTKLMK